MSVGGDGTDTSPLTRQLKETPCQREETARTPHHSPVSWRRHHVSGRRRHGHLTTHPSAGGDTMSAGGDGTDTSPLTRQLEETPCQREETARTPHHSPVSWRRHHVSRRRRLGHLTTHPSTGGDTMSAGGDGTDTSPLTRQLEETPCQQQREETARTPHHSPVSWRRHHVSWRRRHGHLTTHPSAGGDTMSAGGDDTDTSPLTRQLEETPCQREETARTPHHSPVSWRRHHVSGRRRHGHLTTHPSTGGDTMSAGGDGTDTSPLTSQLEETPCQLEETARTPHHSPVNWRRHHVSRRRRHGHLTTHPSAGGDTMSAGGDGTDTSPLTRQLEETPCQLEETARTPHHSPVSWRRHHVSGRRRHGHLTTHPSDGGDTMSAGGDGTDTSPLTSQLEETPCQWEETARTPHHSPVSWRRHHVSSSGRRRHGHLTTHPSAGGDTM